MIKLLDADDFYFAMDDFSDVDLEEFVTTMKSLYNDTKRLASLILRLKDLISTS
jgi:hypothetical protein